MFRCSTNDHRPFFAEIAHAGLYPISRRTGVCKWTCARWHFHEPSRIDRPNTIRVCPARKSAISGRSCNRREGWGFGVAGTRVRPSSGQGTDPIPATAAAGVPFPRSPPIRRARCRCHGQPASIREPLAASASTESQRRSISRGGSASPHARACSPIWRICSGSACRPAIVWRHASGDAGSDTDLATDDVAGQRALRISEIDHRASRPENARDLGGDDQSLASRIERGEMQVRG